MHARVETAPYLFIAVDAFVAAVAAAFTLPVGVLQFSVPVIVLLIIYAGGEYSFLSEARVHPRLGIFLASAFLVLVCAAPFPRTGALWIMPVAAVERMALAAACSLALVATHGALGRMMRTRGRRFLFHLRPDMEQAAASLARHLSRSGYPARVVLDADASCPADSLPVDEWIASPGRGRAGSRGAPPFDPAAFCDTALRLLPPAVLSVRKRYVSWEALRRSRADLLKRAFDVTAASVLLVLSIPLLAVASLLILASEGRPVLFRQVRVGRFGARFSLLKLRTLRDTTVSSATPNDDIEERVFPFGVFLRRTRLDELPQLLNILRGDMSLVGPRPEMEFFHARWSAIIPFYRQRLLVRPGLSGWAQVRFAHTSTEPDYWDKTAYDLWYVVHRNLVLDLRICLRTIGVILFGDGAR